MLKEQTVWQYIELKISVLRSENRRETAKNYGTTRNSLRRFRPDDSLCFTDIDEDFVNAYNSYLLKSGMQMATVSFYNRTLRSIYNQAVKDGLVKNTHPFDEVYTKVVANHSSALSISDSNGIKVNLEDISKEELVRQFQNLQRKYNSLVGKITDLVRV